MDANELRALAEALPEGVHWSDPITPDMLAEAIRRFCADAQPMAMLESHRRLVERAIQDAERPSGMSTHDGKARIDASVLRRMLAIIDSLPAAPQAEPIDLDAVAMQQMRQAAAESTWMPSEYTSNDWIADVCRWLRDGPPAAAPQAEPKREPLSDERIAEIQRAAYERAAQECIETAAELRRCADGCTDGRYDWKADGALDCADAIRALGRQHG